MKLQSNRMKHWVAGLGIAACASAVGAVQPATANVLTLTCYACHGTYGASAGPLQPSIGGQNPKYMFETLKRYQNGERPSTVMGRIMAGYSDPEMKAIADQLAKYPFVAATHQRDVNPVKAEQGKALHDQYCKKCHQDNGRDFAEGAGILGGQWLGFLKIVFQEYKAGKRTMPKEMGERIGKVTDEDCDKLAHFYASQKL
jgi:cytochrome subunit of sulfide dehydrogenase